MRLAAAARHGNRMVCTDGYTGAALFSGQLGLYDDNKRDSETAERRVISLDPSVTLPARRVVAAAGTRFILGHANPDDFRGSTLRVGYVAQEAPVLSQVRSLNEVCTNAAGFSAYAGMAWVKNAAFTEQSSELTPQFHFHYASGEPVLDDSIVTYGTKLFIVRASNLGAGGTLVATCEELVTPNIETVAVTNGVYDPVADTVTGALVSVRVLRMRWQSLFRYRSNLAPAFSSADAQVAVSKSAMTILPGATMSMSDGIWKVASVLSEGSVWLCRATRHA